MNLLELCDVLVGHGDNLNRNLFLSCAAFEDCCCLLDSACTQLIWLLRNGALELAVFDSGETIGGAVEAEDLYFLASAGAQGFNCTKGHLIIFSEDCLDIRVCLQQVSGDIQAFSAVKVRGQLGYNLNIWICSDAFFKTLAAVAGCGRTSDALQNQDFAFFANSLCKGIGSLLAAGDVVGSHETCYFTGIGGAVYCDNWNISVVQRLHGRAHGIRVSGVDDDHIGTGGLSIAQLIRLGSCVIGRVLDIQVDTELVRSEERRVGKESGGQM